MILSHTTRMTIVSLTHLQQQHCQFEQLCRFVTQITAFSAMQINNTGQQSYSHRFIVASLQNASTACFKHATCKSSQHLIVHEDTAHSSDRRYWMCMRNVSVAVHEGR